MLKQTVLTENKKSDSLMEKIIVKLLVRTLYSLQNVMGLNNSGRLKWTGLINADKYKERMSLTSQTSMEGNIKVDIKEIGCECVGCIKVVQYWDQ